MSILADASQDEKSPSSQDVVTESVTSSDQDLRSFLNSLTAHLMPELSTTLDDETEDEQSFMSETKSSEEPISIEDQVADSLMLKSLEDVKEQWAHLGEQISSDDIEGLDEIK